jgi:hypothetical protein
MSVKYLVNGREVSREEFTAGSKLGEVLAGNVPSSPHAAGWPILSDALGVHPSQIAEAMAANRKAGVPTEYTKDGRAVVTDPGHRKRLARSLGIHDRNGGYGDP